MVERAEPNMYVWNADIAEAALQQRRRQGEGAIDDGDDNDHDHDNDEWKGWESLRASARKAPIVIEGEVGLI